MSGKTDSSEKAAKLYEKYKNRMFITACKILNDPYLAEDAVHNAFIAIMRHTDKIGDTDSVKTASYVIKAARNTAINMLKRSQLEVPVLFGDEDISEDESILDRICREENYNAVVRAILSLDEKYRDVLSLYYLNELTVKEIADTLGRKESTVKGQLVRGRRKLIEIIKEQLRQEAEYYEKEYGTPQGF